MHTKERPPTKAQCPQSVAKLWSGITTSLLTFNFFSARAACLQMGCQTSEPKGQQNNKGSDLSRLLALSPPLTPVCSSTFAFHRSQGDPLVNQALCCSFDQPLPLFLPVQILPIPQGPGLTWHLLANFLTCQLGVTSLFSAIHSSLYLS